MFPPFKVIAIDDDAAYLKQIADALRGAGIPCLPLAFPDETADVNRTHVCYARVVFSDLHLVSDGKTGSKADYDAIGTLLERIIPDGGAPVLLVLWTRFPNEITALRHHLAERYPEDKQPLDILALDKTNFADGKVSELPAAIATMFESIPSLRALTYWERDVADAADECARKIHKLAKQAGENFDQALELLLSQLAKASSGKTLAMASPGIAIHDALMPLLADSIANLPGSGDRQERWRSALPSAAAGTVADPDNARAAAINTAIHLLFADAKFPLNGTNRGAVIPIDDALLEYLFDRRGPELLSQFCVDKAQGAVWKAVQIEATCDHAQQKSPALPFVLVVEVPADTKVTAKEFRPLSLWISPRLSLPTGAEVFLLSNIKYAFSLSPSKAKAIDAPYRLRDALTDEIGFTRSQHSIRPGSVTLGGKP